MSDISKEFDVDFRGLLSNVRAKIQLELEQYFAQHPEVKYIYWSQGTPTWNDGEACYFSVHESFAARQDAGEKPDFNDKYLNFSWQQNENLMESLFGSDEVTVKVTPNPITFSITHLNRR